jgi:hypothetical protein
MVDALKSTVARIKRLAGPIVRRTLSLRSPTWLTCSEEGQPLGIGPEHKILNVLQSIRHWDLEKLSSLGTYGLTPNYKYLDMYFNMSQL